MTKDNIQAFTIRVTHANRTELIGILYDIGLVYLKDAISALDGNDKRQFRDEVNHVRSVLKELMNSVNTSIEPGMTLLRIYLFLSGELTRSFIDYTKEPLYHIIGIFNKLSDTYKEVAKLDKSAPVMENAEKVYTGFTYTKNLQSLDCATPDASRGLLV